MPRCLYMRFFTRNPLFKSKNSNSDTKRRKNRKKKHVFLCLSHLSYSSSSNTISSTTFYRRGAYRCNINGVKYSNTISKIVNPAPNVNAGLDEMVCIGDSLFLSANGANSYTWNNGVTNLVKDIKNLIENIDSSVMLSIAVKPNIFEAKYRWYQDWLSWINLDLIDFAVVMNYEKNINKFNFNNRIINNSLTTFGKQKVVIGISTFNQNAIDVADKIILSRLSGFNNFSLYNYNQQQIISDWYNPVINVFNFNIE